MAIASGCRLDSATGAGAKGSARLSARPQPDGGPASPGSTPLGLASGRDGLLYVPTTVTLDAPAPLVLFLHGAGGSASDAVAAMAGFADQVGFLLLAPSSRAATWDMVLGEYGPDVAYIDLALDAACTRCNVDTARVVVAGFSDGASYALALGRANGDVFHRIVAFSPGILDPVATVGKPPILIAHGTLDPVLPYSQTSNIFIPRLQSNGYDVVLEPFEGGHVIPAALAPGCLAWGVADSPPP